MTRAAARRRRRAVRRLGGAGLSVLLVAGLVGPAGPATADHVAGAPEGFSVEAVDEPASQTFTPDGDGVEDTVTVAARFNQPVTVTFQVQDAAGVAVADPVVVEAGEYSEQRGYTASFTWDGDDRPVGAYRLAWSADGHISHDSTAGTATLEITDVPSPTAAVVAPEAGTELADGSEVVLRLSGTGCVPVEERPWQCKASGGRLETAAGVPFGDQYRTGIEPLDVRVTAVPGNVDNGAVDVVGVAFWQDRHGHTHEVRTAPRSFTVSSTDGLELLSDDRVVYPNVPERWYDARNAGVRYRLGRRTTAEVAVLRGDTVVATPQPAALRGAGDNLVWWDGRDDDGEALPDGEYVLRVTAQTAGEPLVATGRIGVDGAVPTVTVTPGDGAAVDEPVQLRTTVAGGGLTITGSAFTATSERGARGTVGWRPAAPGDDLGTEVVADVDPTALLEGRSTVQVSVGVQDAYGFSFSGPDVALVWDVTAALRVTGTTTPFELVPGGATPELLTDYRTSRPATVTAVVRSTLSGEVVRTLEDGVAVGPDQQRQLSWDGRDDAGDLVAGGPYEVQVTATQGALTGTLSRPVTVRRDAEPVIIAPVDGAEVSGQTDVTVTVPEGYGITGAELRDAVSQAVLGTSGLGDGPTPSVTIRFDADVLPAGEHTVVARVTVVDARGGTGTVLSEPVRWTAAGRFAVEGDETPTDLEIDGNPTTALVLGYSLTAPGTVTTTVEAGDGSVVATLEDAVERPGDRDLEVRWDGRAASGALVPSGEYAVVVRATDRGRTAELRRPVTVTSTVAGALSLGTPADVLSGDVEVVFTPEPGTEPGWVSICAGNWHSCYPSWGATAGEDGRWRATVDTTALANGPQSLRAMAYDGGTGSARSSTPLAVVVANAVAIEEVYGPSGTLWVNDGDGDRGVLSVFTSVAAELTAVVRDAAGETVRTLSGGGERTSHDVVWDGRDDAGVAVPDGDYTVTLTAFEDDTASGDEQVRTFSVGRRDVGALAAPTAGAVLEETGAFAYRPAGVAADLRGVDFVVRRTGLVRFPQRWTFPGTQGGDGTWTAVADLSGLLDGAYEVYASLTWADPQGGLHRAGTPVVPVTVKQPGALAGISGGRAFSPDGDGYEDVLDVDYRLPRPADVTVAVLRGTGGTGEVVRSWPAFEDLWAGPHGFGWDGTVDGEPVPPGRYTVRLEATDDTGGTDTELVPVVVMGVPGTLSGPPSDVPAASPVVLTWQPAPGVRATAATLYDGDQPVRDVLVGRDGGIVVSVDLARQEIDRVCDGRTCVPVFRAWPNGPHAFSLRVQWVDELGAVHDAPYRTAPADVLVVNPLRSALSAPDPVLASTRVGDEPLDWTGTLRADQPVGVRAVVRRGDGTTGGVVRTLAGSAVDSYVHTVSWDGKGDDGAAVADGVYTVVVTATERFGDLQDATTARVQVRRAPVGAFTSPSEGATVAPGVDFVYTAAPGVTLSALELVDGDGLKVADGVEGPTGTWRFSPGAARMPDGENRMQARMRWRTADTPAGVTDSWTDARTVHVTADVAVADLDGPKYFTPNGDGHKDTWRTKFRTAAVGLTVEQFIETQDGRPVRTLRSVATGNAGTSNGAFGPCERRSEETVVNGERAWYREWSVCDDAEWDGRDDDGELVPDGRYVLRVRVVGADGRSSEVTGLVGVETDAPLVGSLAPGDVVADRLTLTHRRRTDGHAIHPGSVVTVRTGVQKTLAQQTSRYADGVWSTAFDLPTRLPDELVLETWMSWADEWEGEHTTVTRVPVTVDTTTLDLGFSSSAPAGHDPHPQVFRLVLPGTAAEGVRYTVDPGDAGDGAAALSGTFPAGVRSLELPYTYRRPGSFTATAVVVDGDGNRRHDTLPVLVGPTPPAKPVVTLTVSPERGVAPAQVTARLSATVTDDSELDYRITWGDGSSSEGELTGPVEVTRTLAEPGAYAVSAHVTASLPDRKVTSAGSAHATVVVGEDEPLLARIADGDATLTTVDGVPVPFDATGSSGLFDVRDEDVTWDLGDGTRRTGLAFDHEYAEEGTYLVTVRVQRGDEVSEATRTVVVKDSATTSVSTVRVTGAGGAPVAGAQLVRSLGTETLRATAGPDGTATVYGLPEGTSTLSAWAPDHQPGTATVVVTDGVGTGTAVLTRGALADATVTQTAVNDPELLAEYGVDPNAADNRNFVEWGVSVPFSSNPEDPPLSLRGVYSDRGSEGSPRFSGPDGSTLGLPCVEKGPDGLPRVVKCANGGGGGSGGIYPEVRDVGNGEKALVVVFQPGAGSLKEFFAVETVVQLLGAPDSGASIEGLTATLTYDKDALGLPRRHDAEQPPTQAATEPLRPGVPQRFSWLVRGDKAGDHDVSVDLAGVLQPFGARVEMTAQEPVTLKVYGTNAYRFIVQVPERVVVDQPTEIRMGFENLTPDLPLHGLTVQVARDDGQFVFQPDPRTGLPASEPKALEGPLEPGERAFVSFPIIPTFTGELDLAGATVVRTSGAEQTGVRPEDVVEVLQPDGEDSGPPATLDVTDLGGGQARVTWSRVEGASGYHVYVTPDLLKGFGTPVASPDGGTLSTVIDVPDTFTPAGGTALRRPALAGSLTAAESGALAKKVVVQSVVGGLHKLKHPVKSAFASCGGGVDALYGDWDLQGCLNKQVDGWLASVRSGELVKLNGLVIEPLGTEALKVKMTTADGAGRGALVANAERVKVGLDAGPALGVLPLYEGPLQWDLNGPLTLAAKVDDVLGIPISGAVTVTTDGKGRARVVAKASAPAVLGGAAGDLALTVDNTTGLHLDTLRLAVAEGSIAGAAYSGELSYDVSATGARRWAVTGTATAPGSRPAVTGFLEHAADGTVTKGELHASGLHLLGAVKVDRLSLRTTGGGTWSAAVKAEVPGAAAVDGRVEYVVDERTGAVASAEVTAGRVALQGLVEVTGFAATYAGDTRTWTATGTVATAGASAAGSTFAGTWVTDPRTGAVSDGSLTVTRLPFGDLFVVEDLLVDYDAAAQRWDGELRLARPGASGHAGSGRFQVVDRVLQDLDIRLTDARVGGLLRISDGAFRYQRADGSFALSATAADVGNLVGITDVTASRTGKTWKLAGTGPDASGKTVSVDATMTFDGGALTSGSLDLDGLSFGGLVPVERVLLVYSPGTGWAVAAGGAGDGLSLSFAVADGALVSGAVDIPRAVVAGVAEVAFAASYAAEGEKWSASAKVDTPGGAVKDFALDMTYEKGTLTAGSISGTLGLKGGLVAQIERIAYSRADDTWEGSADIVLPGPAGTAVGGSLKIVKGQFASGEVRVKELHPGLPLGAGVFVTAAELAVALEPEVLLSGEMTLAAGPGGPVTVRAEIALAVRDDGTAQYTLEGDLEVVGNRLADAGLVWDTRGVAAFHGTLGYGVAPLARVDAGLRAAVDATGFRALAEASVVLGGQTLTGQVLADAAGVTACGQYAGKPDWSVGFSSPWRGPITVIADSCSIGPWAAPAAPRAGSLRRAPLAALALTPGATFSVPAGLPVYAAEFVGTATAPDVVLTGPGGESHATAGVDGLAPGGGFVVVRDPAARTTYVLLDAPRGGTWTSQVVTDGGNALASSRVAAGLPEPEVTGSVTGAGAERTLGWELTERAGQTVRFVEALPDGTTRALGTATGASGTLRFPVVGGPGRRAVSAVVEQDGALRAALRLAEYAVTGVVPPPATPPATVPATPPATAPATVPATATPTGSATPGALPVPAVPGPPALPAPSVPVPSAPPSSAAPSSAPPSPADAPGELSALPEPQRVLDTRTGAGGPGGARLGSTVLTLPDSVPADASAVLLNVTVTGGAGRGHVVVHAGGAEDPGTSNVNFVAGETQANLVVTRLGPDRTVTLTVAGSPAYLIADVVGSYAAPEPPGALARLGGFLRSLVQADDGPSDGVVALVPARVLDSRDGTGTVRGAKTGPVRLRLPDSVPADAQSVLLNVTATAATRAGHVTAHAAGTARPGTSNVNLVPGRTQANLVLVEVGADRSVVLDVKDGPMHLLADLVGYAVGDGPAVPPVRLLDSRTGLGTGKGVKSGPVRLRLPDSVPADARAVVLNVTVTGAAAAGHVTAYAAGQPKPATSNVNYRRGQTQANLVVVPVGADRSVVLDVHGGATGLLADLVGVHAAG